jgi:hypothetical protein
MEDTQQPLSRLPDISGIGAVSCFTDPDHHRTRGKQMSLLTIAIVNAVLAVAAVGALTAISRIPFRLDASKSTARFPLREPVALAA